MYTFCLRLFLFFGRLSLQAKQRSAPQKKKATPFIKNDVLNYTAYAPPLSSPAVAGGGGGVCGGPPCPPARPPPPYPQSGAGPPPVSSLPLFIRAPSPRPTSSVPCSLPLALKTAHSLHSDPTGHWPDYRLCPQPLSRSPPLRYSTHRAHRPPTAPARRPPTPTRRAGALPFRQPRSLCLLRRPAMPAPACPAILRPRTRTACPTAVCTGPCYLCAAAARERPAAAAASCGCVFLALRQCPPP
jgi:hypothetical protein